MNVIRSHKHEIFTEEINKVALSGNDDKRIVLENRIHTLAYGHHSTRQVQKNSARLSEPRMRSAPAQRASLDFRSAVSNLGQNFVWGLGQNCVRIGGARSRPEEKKRVWSFFFLGKSKKQKCVRIRGGDLFCFGGKSLTHNGGRVASWGVFFKMRQNPHNPTTI